MSQKNVKKDVVSEMSALKNLLQNYDDNEILTESGDLESVIGNIITRTNDTKLLNDIITDLEAGILGQSFGKGITDITKHFQPDRQGLIDFARAKIEKIKRSNQLGVDYQSK
jgi:hypothetical protein